MDIQFMRAKVASFNIANANSTSPKKLDFDFKKSIIDLSNTNNDVNFLQRSEKYVKYLHSNPVTSIKIDEEILEAISASGRYQGIAEMLNRSYGIMQIVLQGRGA